jgi:hypothetical protein
MKTVAATSADTSICRPRGCFPRGRFCIGAHFHDCRGPNSGIDSESAKRRQRHSPRLHDENVICFLGRPTACSLGGLDPTKPRRADAMKAANASSGSCAPLANSQPHSGTAGRRGTPRASSCGWSALTAPPRHFSTPSSYCPAKPQRSIAFPDRLPVFTRTGLRPRPSARLAPVNSLPRARRPARGRPAAAAGLGRAAAAGRAALNNQCLPAGTWVTA